jgi:hydrogenase expression/formation protein HypE
MKLPPGKVPTEILKESVFQNLGAKRRDVILGPMLGEDAAIVRIGAETMVVATDPITGAEKWLGWLAVNVSANDVATCGVEPRWFSSCLLLPRASKKGLIEKICGQMDKAARQLNMAIIGGHCEITPGIRNPIVVGCSIGIADKGKYVTSSGAKVGNRIIMTKGAGIEGTAILATDRRDTLRQAFDESFLEKAENLLTKISVVKDALTAFRTGGVYAMHDPTEGGIAGGLHELADAANVDFQIHEEKIVIPEETRRICDYFGIDPLQLVSSGSLLVAAEEERAEVIVEELLQNGIDASIVGEVTSPGSGRRMVTKKGEEIELARPISDQLWLALEAQSVGQGKKAQGTIRSHI